MRANFNLRLLQYICIHIVCVCQVKRVYGVFSSSFPPSRSLRPKFFWSPLFFLIDILLFKQRSKIVLHDRTSKYPPAITSKLNTRAHTFLVREVLDKLADCHGLFSYRIYKWQMEKQNTSTKNNCNLRNIKHLRYRSTRQRFFASVLFFFLALFFVLRFLRLFSFGIDNK